MGLLNIVLFDSRRQRMVGLSSLHAITEFQIGVVCGAKYYSKF